jgi:glucosamine--fructose-6-phosphate aminotransferase (isomerizing)
MCGIYGFVSENEHSANEILEGLKLLEYRGYDSWGVAIKLKNTIVVDRSIGKIGNAKLKPHKSNIGIGHTRWATHGGVTIQNAHPHLDCNKTIAVVHNGIIENYQELKQDLIKKKHKFISETDTEVFAHLVEELLKKNGFSTAVRKAFNLISGLNAVVVMNSLSSEIIAAKTGSPLIVGISDKEFFISSDVAGIIKHTRKVIFIEDNQMVILGKKLQLLHLPDGRKITPEIQTLTWKFEQTQKGKFKHFLLKEIYEQPHVLENIATNHNDVTKKLSSLITKAFGTFMLGCGTASYAALFGTYVFSKVAKKHVNFIVGSEFNYLEDYITKKSLVIPISQSGETIDVVQPVNTAKKKGATIAAITNVLGSTIYRQANSSILLNAGPEKAVVGTKSFTAMVAVLLLTAYTNVKKQNEGKELLIKTANNVSEILKAGYITKIKKVAKKLKAREHIYVLGRGLSYATALEATLKLKETSYVHAEGFAGGELKHGVIALIEKGTPCIIMAPNDETYADIISNAQEVKARGAYIIGIGPKGNSVFDEYLPTKDCKEATIIPQVVIAQLLAYYIALEKGISDPDKPRNLAKSVTVK